MLRCLFTGLFVGFFWLFEWTFSLRCLNWNFFLILLHFLLVSFTLGTLYYTLHFSWWFFFDMLRILIFLLIFRLLVSTLIIIFSGRFNWWFWLHLSWGFSRRLQMAGLLKLTVWYFWLFLRRFYTTFLSGRLFIMIRFRLQLFLSLLLYFCFFHMPFFLHFYYFTSILFFLLHEFSLCSLSLYHIFIHIELCFCCALVRSFF